MGKAKPSADRRDEALSRARIVAAAIDLLDREGADGLTFRALAAHLETGPGAIYWHVANKDELLVAAVDAVIARAMRDVVRAEKPHEDIRRVALGVFEAIDAHPWLGTLVARAPWETGMLQIFERIGQRVEALGVRGRAQFTSTSVLVNYILGESIQNAANGEFARRELDPSTDRAAFLERISERWKSLDPEAFPFTRRVAVQLRKHDDRAEFLAGVDLIVAGIGASHGARRR